jgi:hypothetical protein
MRLHASLIASIIAALLDHTHNMQTHPHQEGTPHTESPLHPRRLALQLDVSSQATAQAFDLKGGGAPQSWISSGAENANLSCEDRPTETI